MFIHRWYWSCIFFIISLWYHKFIFQLFTLNKIFFVTSLLWWILTDCHFLEIFHFQLYRLEIFYLTFIGKSMKKLFFLTSPIIWTVFNGLRVLAILCLLPETWKQVGDNWLCCSGKNIILSLYRCFTNMRTKVVHEGRRD